MTERDCYYHSVLRGEYYTRSSRNAEILAEIQAVESIELQNGPIRCTSLF